MNFGEHFTFSCWNCVRRLTYVLLAHWTIFKNRRLSLEILIRCLMGNLHLIGNILWISVTQGLGLEHTILNGTNRWWQGEGKAVPVNSTRHMRVKVQLHPSSPRHYCRCGHFYVLAALPTGKAPPLPTEQEAGWASEPVWTVWKRGKFLAPSGNTWRFATTTRRQQN
jgi:hypothetical protein